MSDPQVLVKNYYQAHGNLEDLLTAIVTRLITIEQQGDILMGKAADINALLDTIYTSTNAIADKIDALLEHGPTGLTKDEADAVETRLSDLATALTVVAAKS